jgi:DNA-binding SARP family transcriptional activator/tetratricopeptide (TPR) repeat protein
MQFRLLGPVEVRARDVLFPVGGPRERRSLVALLLNANRVVTVDRIVEVLWGEAPPPTAATQIRNTMTTLRGKLAAANEGPAPVVRSGAGFLIRIDEDQLDVQTFERHVRQARQLTEQGQPASAAAELHLALQVWRGPALGGLGAPALDVEARGLEERRLSCVERRIELELSVGQSQDVVGELATLTHEYPLRERLAELQVLALFGAGRRQDALAAVAAARARLAEEAGLDPGPELVRLQQAILRGEDVLARPPERVRVSAAGYVRPAQLPADVAAFTGRASHLHELDELLRARSGSAPAVVISSIAGTAGVGKTALAVHWAHRVRDQFADGQLYLNLLGFDPGGATLPPGRALRALLVALGVAPDRVPMEVEAQVGLYRSLLAGRRILVVLDNAHDAEQVRPLLPGTSSSVVVVTSRNLLSGLVATDGAHPLTVDLLAPGEARELLARRLGAARVAAEPAAVDAIVASCAGLPLALVIVAARAAVRPDLALTALADDLDEASRLGTERAGRLDALRTGDPYSDLRKVFSWSYEARSEPARRMFRLLGLNPGADLTAPAAASLCGVTITLARRLLAELTEAHLVAEPTSGRYTQHDLLRAYAAELAHDGDAVPERREAVHRLLDHYLHAAYAAMTTFTEQRDPITLAPPLPGVTVSGSADITTALDWFTREQANLLAALAAAGELGFDRHTWQLAWTLEPFFTRRGQFLDWVSTLTAALHAATRLDDRHTQARVHRNLGSAYAMLGRDVESETHLDHGLELCRQLGDHAGQAHTHHNLARIRERQGRHREGLAHLEQSLELYRRTGHAVGQARALNGIGWYHILLGEYDRAIMYCEQAIDLHRATGGRPTDLGDTWDSLGYAHDHLGHHAEAVDCFQTALRLFRQFGDRYNEAVTLSRLGDAHEHAGDREGANGVWRQALDIFEALDRSEAEAVRIKLANALASGVSRA